jgi:hypothetical protein
MIGTGAAILGAGALSAGASMFGASQAGKAADKQLQATIMAQEAQRRRYDEFVNALSPYMKFGESSLGDLQSRLPFLTSPIVMDQAGLEQTPGYQFTREQGLRAAQNALTATGLGRSGAAVKAATRFGTGLADNTYQTQFNLENVNRSNAFNRLIAAAGVGQNAVSAMGNAGVTTGQGIANSLIQGGNAQAAGIMGGANYLMQGANNIGGNLLLASMMNKGGQGGGGGGGMYSPEFASQFVSSPAWAQPGGSWYN